MEIILFRSTERSRKMQKEKKKKWSNLEENTKQGPFRFTAFLNHSRSLYNCRQIFYFYNVIHCTFAPSCIENIAEYRFALRVCRDDFSTASLQKRTLDKHDHSRSLDQREKSIGHIESSVPKQKKSFFISLADEYPLR